MAVIGVILYWTIGFYLLLLLLRAFLSILLLFIPGWQPSGVVIVLLEAIFTVTDPPLNLLGKYLPPLRLGVVTLDTSFVLLYLGLAFLQRMIVWIIR